MTRNDVISRERALRPYKDLRDDDVISVYLIKKNIKELPSIQPSRKGHWIEHPKGIYAHLVCDKCLSNAPYDIETNFCPNCGACMKDGRTLDEFIEDM